MKCSRCWLATGCIMAGLAVAMGAFAAHGIDTRFAEKYAGETRVVAGETIPLARKYVDDFKTGATYQMYHALGLVLIGLISATRSSKLFSAAGWCFGLGILLFSGGLYLYTLTGNRLWGMIPPPIGGTLFIIGWGLLAAGCLTASTPAACETSPPPES